MRKHLIVCEIRHNPSEPECRQLTIHGKSPDLRAVCAAEKGISQDRVVDDALRSNSTLEDLPEDAVLHRSKKSLVATLGA